MQGVSGVRASLESRHGRITTCKHIHNLTFSFVSPLEAKDYVKF